MTIGKHPAKIAIVVAFIVLVLIVGNIFEALEVAGIICGVIFAVVFVLAMLAIICGYFIERRGQNKLFAAFYQNDDEATFHPKDVFDEERMDYEFFRKNGVFLEKEGFEIVEKVVAQMGRYTACVDLYMSKQPSYVELYINKKEGIIALLGQSLIDNSKGIVSKERRDVHNQVRPPMFEFYTPFQNHTELTVTGFLISGLKNVCTHNHRLIAHPYKSIEEMLKIHRQAMREHNALVRTDRFPENYQQYANAQLESSVESWIDAGFAKRVGYSKIKVTFKGSIKAIKNVIKIFILRLKASPYISKKKNPSIEKTESFTVYNPFFDTAFLSEPEPQSEPYYEAEEKELEPETRVEDVLEKEQPIQTHAMEQNTEDASTSEVRDSSNDKKDQSADDEDNSSIANIIVSLFFVVAVLVLALSLLNILWKDVQVSNWPQTQGVIEYSELIPSSANRIIDASPSHQEFDLRYIYEVDGQEYKGRRLYLYGNYAILGADWSELMEKYSEVGSEVTVNYNSDQPYEAALESSGLRIELLIILVALALTLFVMSRSLIKKIKKRREKSTKAHQVEEPFDKNDKTWQGGALRTGLSLLLGLGFAVAGVASAYEGINIQSEERNYLLTRGQVIEFDYSMHIRQNINDRDEERFDIDIAYEYEVDGQTFQGTVINFFLKDEMVDRERFDKWETFYFEGNEVNVFYNPDYPEEAVLERVVWNDYINLISIGIVGLMSVVSISMGIGIIQKRRKNK